MRSDFKNTIRDIKKTIKCHWCKQKSGKFWVAKSNKIVCEPCRSLYKVKHCKLPIFLTQILKIIQQFEKASVEDAELLTTETGRVEEYSESGKEKPSETNSNLRKRSDVWEEKKQQKEFNERQKGGSCPLADFSTESVTDFEFHGLEKRKADLMLNIFNCKRKKEDEQLVLKEKSDDNLKLLRQGLVKKENLNENVNKLNQNEGKNDDSILELFTSGSSPAFTQELINKEQQPEDRDEVPQDENFEPREVKSDKLSLSDLPCGQQNIIIQENKESPDLYSNTHVFQSVNITLSAPENNLQSPDLPSKKPIDQLLTENKPSTGVNHQEVSTSNRKISIKIVKREHLPIQTEFQRIRFCFSGFKKYEKLEEIDNFIQKLKLKLKNFKRVDKVADATHLIVNTKEGACARSYKFLEAGLLGLPIVCFEFLEVFYQTLDTNKAFEYLVNEDNGYGKSTLSLNVFRKDLKLFQNVTFYLSGCEITPECYNLVKLAGGKIRSNEKQEDDIEIIDQVEIFDYISSNKIL